MSVVKRQLVLNWWISNWYVCDGGAFYMDVVDR